MRQWVSTFYKVSGLQTDAAPVSRPWPACPQRPRPGAQDPRGAGASAEQGRAQCGHQALAASQKHTWDPMWSLTAAVMNQSKATNEHTDAREGLAHEARVWVRFSARCGRNVPRAARMLGADTGSPRSLPGRPHCPRGRRKVPASCLGTMGTQQGRCAGRDPRRGSSRSPAERRVLLPARRVHHGLCVSTSETEDAPSAPPGQARSSINVPQNRREGHTDPRAGQATWAGQVPNERAGRRPLSPSSPRRGGEASSVSVTRTSPSRPPSQDPRLMPL